MKREYVLNGPNGYGIPCVVWTPERENAVLICLHGFAGDKDSSVIAALAQRCLGRNVRTVAFDWPGHGASPAGATA